MDFIRVDHAIFMPGVCVCGSADGPMIDTGIEKPAVGHIYLCRRCVLNAARTMGCLDPEQRAKVEEQLDHALAEVALLRDDLRDEQQHKVVPLAEVIALLASRQEPSLTGPGRPRGKAA